MLARGGSFGHPRQDHCLCLAIHTPYLFIAHCFQHNDIHVYTPPSPQLSRKVSSVNSRALGHRADIRQTCFPLFFLFFFPLFSFLFFLFFLFFSFLLKFHLCFVSFSNTPVPSCQHFVFLERRFRFVTFPFAQALQCGNVH